MEKGADMLYPLFDKECNLVGWIKPDEHIFNADMEWIAYIVKENAWSARTGNWMGPVDGLNCLDIRGKVVAWNPGCKISPAVHPLRPSRTVKPSRPLKPARPIRPARPVLPTVPAGIWSELSLEQWQQQ